MLYYKILKGSIATAFGVANVDDVIALTPEDYAVFAKDSELELEESTEEALTLGKSQSLPVLEPPASPAANTRPNDRHRKD